MRSVSCQDLLAFIERSAPPLRRLALGWKSDDFPNSIQLHECLLTLCFPDVTPSLTRIQMRESDWQTVTSLFAALADSPSLLPNLRNLNIHIGYDPDTISHSSWRNLIHVLSTRRCLERLYIDNIRVSPPADILATLRELMDDGVELYIGTEELDFVA
ncbi:hypothetical protein B0H12DRAFT_1158454 [Mycena haematopus]|nr:hypothetical protein B0H12DRAFT_1158454 [Mycena haematopus]